MNIPTDLKYTKEHEWIKVDDDVATIGISDFAQSELGELVYIEVETVGMKCLVPSKRLRRLLICICQFLVRYWNSIAS